MRYVYLIFAAVPFVCFCRATQAEVPQAGRQVAQQFQHPDFPELKLGYLLYLPRDFGQANQKAPLLLFLHGAGERGDEIALVKTHGPPRLLEQGQHLPFVVVSPQCPREQRWDPELLLALLDDLCSRYSIDPARVSVTGLSLGGSGTWSLIAADPGRFAAAVPICGRANPWMVNPASQVPVWIVVGDKDAPGLVSNCRAMENSLQLRGADIKLTIMHGIGHDSWSQTYATPEVYDWILRQRRKE